MIFSVLQFPAWRIVPNRTGQPFCFRRSRDNPGSPTILKNGGIGSQATSHKINAYPASLVKTAPYRTQPSPP